MRRVNNMKDPYVDENNVLINKLNINSYEKLNQAEADICFVNLMKIDSIDINCFDENLIKKIHKFIFDDIFDWAGEYRTVPLYKEEVVIPGLSLNYTNYNKIDEELKNKINELNSISWSDMSIKDISFIFARKLAIIWKIHPFRDGNTRTILSFAFLYAREHSFPFDMVTFTNELSRKYNSNGNISAYSVRDKFVLASLDDNDCPEVGHLAYIFEKAISNYSNNIKRKI